MIVAMVGAEIVTVEYTESCGKYTLPQNLVEFFCYDHLVQKYWGVNIQSRELAVELGCIQQSN